MNALLYINVLLNIIDMLDKIDQHKNNQNKLIILCY